MPGINNLQKLNRNKMLFLDSSVKLPSIFFNVKGFWVKGLFRVTLCLCFETSKRVFVEDLSYEKSLICVKINLLVELIFIR